MASQALRGVWSWEQAQGLQGIVPRAPQLLGDWVLNSQLREMSDGVEGLHHVGGKGPHANLTTQGRPANSES